MSFVVAIDGPAGTGKGTITELISKEIGLINIDTGAMYRCVALGVLRNNINIEDEDNIVKLIDTLQIDMKNNNGIQSVFLNGEDVSKEIRTKEVTQIVSQVSSIKEVRFKMVELQRKMAKGKDVVMEGRDITTYVFPNANVKIYLDAKEEERARRRYKEMQEKNIDMSYDEVLENIRLRDKNDKEKEIGALKIAEDATYIDTTNMTIQQVKQAVIEVIKLEKKI